MPCHLPSMPSGAGRERCSTHRRARGARRQGVGRALTRERPRAEGLGFGRLGLADNPDAEAFYAAYGFRRGEDDEQGVLMLLTGQAPRAG